MYNSLMNSFRKYSLSSKGLRYKTLIAFALGSVIPILVCSWIIIEYVFPHIEVFLGLTLGNISLILYITVALSILGLTLVRDMTDPMIRIANHAKGMAKGNVDMPIDIVRDDEIGDISLSLNTLRQRIKDNMDELRNYSEQTKLINVEINKKVTALSSVVEIGNLMSRQAELYTLLNFITGKAPEILEYSASFMALKEREAPYFRVVAYSNIDQKVIDVLRIEGETTLTTILIIDDEHFSGNSISDRITKALNFKNIILLPILVKEKFYGIFCVGNREKRYRFKDDDLEILKVFCKEASIAIENDLLLRKTKELSITDELTGLYNERFIKARLSEEIKRACIYQRPCGYLVIDVDDFEVFKKEYGEVKANELLIKIGEMLKGMMGELDKIGRLKNDEFSVIIPEKNKKQLLSIAEELRLKLETSLSKALKITGKLTVTIGVSENPIDGSTAEELMNKAESLVKEAKS